MYEKISANVHVMGGFLKIIYFQGLVRFYVGFVGSKRFSRRNFRKLRCFHRIMQILSIRCFYNGRAKHLKIPKLLSSILV
jgi:hypothetical protein